MRHIAVVACGTDVHRVPPVLHELARRNRVCFADCYVLTTVADKKPSSPIRSSWHRMVRTQGGSVQSFGDNYRHLSDSHGKVLFELIRRLTSQDDTVLHVLLISAPGHIRAIAIGALLLYGRNHDRLFMLLRTTILSCELSCGNLPVHLRTLNGGLRTIPRRGTFSTDTRKGGSIFGVDGGNNTAALRGSSDAVLDWRRCLLRIGRLEIHLRPVECALYWWLLQAKEPIPWGKSLRDEDWLRFCACYTAICRARRNCRSSDYSLQTDFDLRLTVLQKTVSTIKRKLNVHLDPWTAKKYAPHVIGKYAEKSLTLSATVQFER